MARRRVTTTQLTGSVKSVVAICDTRFNCDRSCIDCKYYGDTCKKTMRALNNLYGFRGENRPSDYVAFFDHLHD